MNAYVCLGNEVDISYKSSIKFFICSSSKNKQATTLKSCNFIANKKA